MSDEVLSFYDQLADSYHNLFTDWRHAIEWQGEALDTFIRGTAGFADAKGISLLDCSCGIGTQAIGLALRGYEVTATDLSPQSIERARKEAESIGATIRFGVADFRYLDRQVEGRFDVVLTADNAIPHLLGDEDLAAAARGLYAKTADGGLLVATIRDYDALVLEAQSGTLPRMLDNGTRLVFQVWEWSEDRKTYYTNQFILRADGSGWQTRNYRTPYRALLRKELTEFLREAGFSDIAWHMPEASGYYQPIVTARRV
ncbi:class I SAM-dependent methyltransferase [Cohnella panacarvi]|uniref:class I SAM-dependent methyltransferase n=1 Tax=Cohnella panacarvi TaxID=400776 RepID=UPI00047C11AD|nr:class I SAM-dependent methyltransferase [Cohnella panacarvi]